MELIVNIERIKAQITRIDREKRALERKIEALQQQKLTALPRQVGLESVDSLIVALGPYASQALRMRLQSMRFEGADEETLAAPNGVAKRTRFSAEMREQIRAELESGAKSVAQIAREYGPSHPTIMGWKREWGMTHPRPRRSPNSGSGAR